NYIFKVDGQRVNIEPLQPVPGGAAFSKDVVLPAGAVLTVQAFDDAFNVGPPAQVALPGTGAGNTPGGGGGNTPGGSGNTPGGANGCSVGGKLPRSSISGRNLK